MDAGTACFDVISISLHLTISLFGASTLQCRFFEGQWMDEIVINETLQMKSGGHFVFALEYFVCCVLYSGHPNLIMAVIHFDIVINIEESISATQGTCFAQFSSIVWNPDCTFFRCLL